ncbi:MAG: 30S ribosomal protein S6 [Elusimicrobiaceae bacterium]|nr:30S ribosomal protein S6 [Elusimicrobiaceae bacterium]
MHSYEQITILKPQLSDKEIAEFVTKAKEYITSNGGEVVSEESYGRKKLSHPIKHVRDGYYSYLKYKCTFAVLNDIRRMSRLNENVMRSIVFQSHDSK